MRLRIQESRKVVADLRLRTKLLNVQLRTCGCRLRKLKFGCGFADCGLKKKLEVPSTAGHGMESKLEWKFRYGIWKMPEWNGIFLEWNGRKSIILPYQFHTRFRALYLQKNTYRCRVVINNIVTEIFNFNIYAYYLSTNCGTLVVYIVQTVYVLHH